MSFPSNLAPSLINLWSPKLSRAIRSMRFGVKRDSYAHRESRVRMSGLRTRLLNSGTVSDFCLALIKEIRFMGPTSPPVPPA